MNKRRIETMKVILLSDVKKVGKKGEVVEVSDGFGRNFLINKKLAVLATAKSMEILEEQTLQRDGKEAELEAKAKELKEKLAAITLEFHVKTSTNGRIFGSVSMKQVVGQLQNTYGIHVEKRKIIDNNAITNIGYTNIKVDLYKNKVIGVIRVHVNG